MKISFATLFTLLVPTAAYRLQIITDENGERRLKPIPQNVIEHGRKMKELINARRLQEDGGAAVPGYVDPTQWTGKYCKEWNVRANITEVIASEGADGNTHSFPIYFAEQMGLGAVGYFQDAATPTSDEDESCVFNAAFNFLPPNENGQYDNQVAISGLCEGNSNVITGGTGDFACASGYEYFTGDDGEWLDFTVYYCSGCEW